MAHFNWTIRSYANSIAGEGDHNALVRAVALSNPPGLAPADWIVDILLAEGLDDGGEVLRHEGTDAWSLEVSVGPASAFRG